MELIIFSSSSYFERFCSISVSLPESKICNTGLSDCFAHHKPPFFTLITYSYFDIRKLKAWILARQPLDSLNFHLKKWLIICIFNKLASLSLSTLFLNPSYLSTSRSKRLFGLVPKDKVSGSNSERYII